MQALELSIQQFFENHLAADSKLLVACSGGVDSMVLLHVLLQLDYKPVIAHCNFGLRGKDADEDARFVSEFGTTHGLTCISKKFDTTGFAAKHGISIQMAARELRYEFFEEVLKNNKLDFLCTAHHADDSLETLLLNLGRGTGFNGLGGIKPLSGNIARPLWRCGKEDILEYAKMHKIAWREDASNEKDSYQRNFLRHQVIPKMKENFPHFESSFGRSLQWLFEDRQLFENLLARQLKDLVQNEGSLEKVKIQALVETGQAEALLRHWLSPKALFDRDSVYHSLSGESGLMFEAGNYRLLRDREFLILSKSEKKAHEEYEISLAQDSINLPLAMEMQQIPNDDFQLIPDKKTAALDFALLKFPLKIRRWHTGDSFFPLGMKGHKKLSDYFIDRKYSRFEKENIWLLCSDNEIVWVIGDRIDDRFRITNTTKTVYFVRLL